MRLAQLSDNNKTVAFGLSNSKVTKTITLLVFTLFSVIIIIARLVIIKITKNNIG